MSSFRRQKNAGKDGARAAEKARDLRPRDGGGDLSFRLFFFGLFLFGLFGLRFLIEFIKEPQEGTDQVLAAASSSLNMGQLLSLPFILAGIGVFIWARVRKLPGKRVTEDKPRKKTETHFAHGL